MYRSRALVTGPRKHLHRVGDKMAALRVIVLSGNGRALLSTSKTTKTLTVCRCLSISFQQPEKPVAEAACFALRDVRTAG